MMPVAVWSRARVCCRLLPAGIVGSILAGGIDVCLLCVCCVLLGRVLCVGLITCLEESYRVSCV